MKKTILCLTLLTLFAPLTALPVSAESSAADTTRRTSRTESELDLIDRAESAVDSMREDITSLVREGTREVHPFD